MSDRYRGMRACLHLLLLFSVVGCDAPETVKVSGAVVRPGALPYRSNWDVRDYVAAAGGYLEEADSQTADLVRVVSDIAGTGTLTMERSRLAEVALVMPDDEIWVPRLRCRVQMDSVYTVTDLSIDWQEHEYRVSEGLLVPGQSERGVLAAAVLGDGEVIRSSDGDTLGQFHYLYLRTAPDVFGQIREAAGTRVRDLEALEDAVALHGLMCDRLGDSDEAGLELPEPGALRVVAGRWPSPRSSATHGPGIRKGTLADGSEVTTYPDGRRRTRHPDGTVVVSFSDGGREVRRLDGSRQFRTSSGVVKTVSADGRTTVDYPDGNRKITFTDGRVEERFATGTTRTMSADGTEETLFADGTVEERRQDGRKVVRSADGQQEVRYPDGRREAVTPEGHRVEVDRSGRRMTRLADGSALEEFPDGSRIQVRPNGERLEVSADGTRKRTFPDGASRLERSDGSRLDRHVDGTTIEALPDGRRIQSDPDGVQLETFPDGREIQTDREGNRLETYPDGRRVQTDRAGNRAEELPDGVKLRTYAHGYRYWKEPRTELVALNTLPESLAVGADLVVGGTIPEGVDGIWIGIFRLPDGGVRAAPVTFSERSFSCAFPDSSLPDRAGHYQLQVVAYKDGEGIVAVDHRLVVGHPAVLGEMRLTILPYRSSGQSAERVRTIVNRARRRAGLRPMQQDAALDRDAEGLLQGGVMPVDQEDGGLRRGDLGSGASVEEVLGFAMMIGPRRSHVLGRRWTRIGVAVEGDGNRARVAQVYAGSER